MEFEDKAVAKRVAALLNGQQMGGAGGAAAYHYDLWTLKYLPKFKWDHLTEEIGAHPAARTACRSMLYMHGRQVGVCNMCCCHERHNSWCPCSAYKQSPGWLQRSAAVVGCSVEVYSVLSRYSERTTPKITGYQATS